MLDAGWLFLLAGLALISATVLVPARADLERARHQRDVALIFAELHAERIGRHETVLAALESRDPVVLDALAASQFNLVRADRRPLPGQALPVERSASVFPQLEPEAVPAPPLPRTGSLLERWTTNERGRVWLFGLGALLVVVGLVPWLSDKPAR